MSSTAQHGNSDRIDKASSPAWRTPERSISEGSASESGASHPDAPTASPNAFSRTSVTSRLAISLAACTQALPNTSPGWGPGGRGMPPPLPCLLRAELLRALPPVWVGPRKGRQGPFAGVFAALWEAAATLLDKIHKSLP